MIIALTQRSKRTVTLGDIVRTWLEVNPGWSMPPTFYDRGIIEVYQGNHQPGLLTITTTDQCAMGPTDASNCLGIGPAPACYMSLPQTIKHASLIAHAFGIASLRPNRQQPYETRGNAKYGGCTRTVDNKKCVDTVADEHLGALQAAHETRQLILELGGCRSVQCLHDLRSAIRSSQGQ